MPWDDRMVSQDQVGPGGEPRDGTLRAGRRRQELGSNPRCAREGVLPAPCTDVGVRSPLEIRKHQRDASLPSAGGHGEVA